MPLSFFILYFYFFGGGFLHPTRHCLKLFRFDSDSNDFIEESVSVSLSFGLLYRLERINSKLYNEYNDIITGGSNSEFDNIKLLFVAYVCANLKDYQNDLLLSYEEFLDSLPDDREYIGDLLKSLVSTSKKK